MKSILFAFALCLVLKLSTPSAVVAQDLGEAEQQGLKQTQELLRDKSQRDAFIKKDAAAKKADDVLNQLGGGNEQFNAEAYQLASEVFEVLAKESGGDPAKMNKAVQEYLRDPAAFAKKFSPEQKAKLKQLGEKVSKPTVPTK